MSHDPTIKIDMAPLHRWHREIWVGGSDRKPDDIVDSATMRKDFAVSAVSRAGMACEGKQKSNDPATAAVVAAMQAGIHMQNSTTLETGRG